MKVFKTDLGRTITTDTLESAERMASEYNMGNIVSESEYTQPERTGWNNRRPKNPKTAEELELEPEESNSDDLEFEESDTDEELNQED